MNKVSFEDISDLITNADDNMYLELVRELVDIAMLEELVIEGFNNLSDDEQVELVQRYNAKFDKEGETTNE